MGTELLLYRCPNAAAWIPHLNAEKTVPVALEEEVFCSKKFANLYPSRCKVGDLDDFLEKNGRLPLHALFGYASAEPDEIYRIPDWEAAQRGLQDNIKAVPSLVKPTSERGENIYRHLWALSEMVEWVMRSPQKSQFLICWSW